MIVGRHLHVHVVEVMLLWLIFYISPNLLFVIPDLAIFSDLATIPVPALMWCKLNLRYTSFIVCQHFGKLNYEDMYMYLRIHQIYMNIDITLQFFIDMCEIKMKCVWLWLNQWYLIWRYNAVKLFQFNDHFHIHIYIYTEDTLRWLDILYNFFFYSQFKLKCFSKSSTICCEKAVNRIMSF